METGCSPHKMLQARTEAKKPVQVLKYSGTLIPIELPTCLSLYKTLLHLVSRG